MGDTLLMTYQEPDNLSYEIHVKELHNKHQRAINSMKPEINNKIEPTIPKNYDRQSGKSKY